MTSVIRIIVFLLVSLTMATALPAAAQGGCPPPPPDPNEDPYSRRPGEHSVATAILQIVIDKMRQIASDLAGAPVELRDFLPNGTAIFGYGSGPLGSSPDDVVVVIAPDGSIVLIRSGTAGEGGSAFVHLSDGTSFTTDYGFTISLPNGVSVSVSGEGVGDVRNPALFPLGPQPVVDIDDGTGHSSSPPCR